MSRASLDTQVRAIVAAEGIRESDLADQLDVHRTTISAWKSGKSEPHPRTAKLLYARYTRAINKLADADPVGRIQRMRAEMAAAVSLINPADVERLYDLVMAAASHRFASAAGREDDRDDGQDNGRNGDGGDVDPPRSPKSPTGIITEPRTPIITENRAVYIEPT